MNQLYPKKTSDSGGTNGGSGGGSGSSSSGRSSGRIISNTCTDDNNNNNSDNNNNNDTTTTTPPLPVVFQLPSGYRINELEKCYALCRGYRGWGWSTTPLPPHLRHTLSHTAHAKIVSEPKSFFSVQSCLASLSDWYSCDGSGGSSGSGCGSVSISDREWCDILTTLQNRIIKTPSIYNTLQVSLYVYDHD